MLSARSNTSLIVLFLGNPVHHLILKLNSIPCVFQSRNAIYIDAFKSWLVRTFAILVGKPVHSPKLKIEQVLWSV